MHKITANNYLEWRDAARRLLSNDIPPYQIEWHSGASSQTTLFSELIPLPEMGKHTASVTKEFLRLAETVSCHRAPDKFALLYIALWRISRGEKHLLQLATDSLTHRLLQMEKELRRDAHKTKAFVRFRLTHDEDGAEHYIAWHRPDHPILPLVAGFFQRRFSVMRWTILTPDQSLYWNGEELIYGAGVTADTAPHPDMLEDVWRSYYRATFNPARIKIKAMKREMPVRHWATLPETQIIQDMLNEAPERVARMIKQQEGFASSAADFLPEEKSLEALREAAKSCQGCPLYKLGCQTVFGEGNPNANIMLVGEQPGEQEDIAGKPFIGPAGKVLDRALEEAGIERAKLYITNAVKHFKYKIVNGAKRHENPSARDIEACKPWLDAEIERIRPPVIISLGATAGRSLIGHGFTLKQYRGHELETRGAQLTATYHPSAILRVQGEQQQQYYHALVEDLKRATTKGY